ncbi:MAG TPA: transcriptional regulator, partial [Hyphomonas sp.]|nr:transcriptional regulator [Hyphomonas sp.]
MTYRKAFRTFLIGAGLIVSTACTSMEGIVSDPDYLSTGAIVEDSSTAYSGQLSCMKWSTPAEKPRIAVGDIRDMTGRFSTFEGAVATQGASLMVMSAVSQAGFPLAERLDTAVAEQELEFANNRLISEAGEPTEDYRKVFTGSIAGSDYIL